MLDVMMLLETLPRDEGTLPRGSRIRPFRRGDESRWVELQASTGVYGPVSSELFKREFGDRTSDHVARIMFIEVAGEAVGVSAGWHPGPDIPASTGRVHWVAVTPSHQRHGLGRALVVATLRQLQELEYTSAYLTTGSENVPAISLYRRLGFEPFPRTAEERTAWQALGVV